MKPNTQRKLKSYDFFLLDLIKYMNQVNNQIMNFSYVDLKKSSELSNIEKKAITDNYKLMKNKVPRNITIKRFKKDLKIYTQPNETNFPKLSKLTNRTDGLWFQIITFIFECNFFDFSIYFSEDEYKKILSTDNEIIHSYFNQISKYVNKESENMLRDFFDYLYKKVIVSEIFLKTYKPCASKTALRKEISEDQIFCPCCMLYEISTGNSQMDHYIPLNLAPFFAIFSENLIVSCVECNGPLVKGPDFLSPILHPGIDDIKDNIKYSLDDSWNIKILHTKNEVKTSNFCTQFKLEDRINGIGDFSGNKKKEIDDELKIFKKLYLEKQELFETDLDIVFDYYTTNNSKKKAFYYKIVTDIASTLTEDDSVFSQTITLK